MNREIKNVGLVSLSDITTSNHTSEKIQLLTTTHSFEIMENDEQHDAYIKDARRILDTESKRFNHRGLERLLAALIMEYVGNNYWGKEN